jgi:hypothetical protein
MFHVVLLELGRGLEGEEVALGALLGVAQYDVRVRLSGVLPRLAFESPVEAEAARVAQGFAERGHSVRIIAAADVVALERLISMHRFSLEAGLISANDQKPQQRPQDLLAMVHFETRAAVVRTGKEKVVRITNRGGAVTEEVDTFRHEGFAGYGLMLVWRDGTRWLLNSGTARYLTLGPDLKRTQRENFETTLAKLRVLAPQAVYDDRFLRSPINAQGILIARGNDSASSHGDSRTDLVMQALAGTYVARADGPYRSMSPR